MPASPPPLGSPAAGDRCCSGAPWIEKHRPRRFEDVVGNAGFVSRLREMAEQGTLPNMVLVGPPGCGKSALIGCLCAGFEVMHLCAHEDRGVDAVRNKIRAFSKRGGRRAVVLDEIDGMAPGPQHSLQRVMETVGDGATFLFACNDSERVIDVIQSRCAVLRLNTAQEPDMRRLAERVAAAEGLRVTNDGLNSLVLSCQGDLRVLVNNLQICAMHAGGREVDADLVAAACDQPSPRTVWRVLELCAAGEVRDALVATDRMWAQGHSPHDVVALLTALVRKSDLPDETIVRLLVVVNQAQMRMSVVTSRLQVAELFVEIAREVRACC